MGLVLYFCYRNYDEKHKYFRFRLFSWFLNPLRLFCNKVNAFTKTIGKTWASLPGLRIVITLKSNKILKPLWKKYKQKTEVELLWSKYFFELFPIYITFQTKFRLNKCISEIRNRVGNMDKKSIRLRLKRMGLKWYRRVLIPALSEYNRKARQYFAKMWYEREQSDPNFTVRIVTYF